MKIVLLLAQVLLIGVSSEDTLCQYSGRQWQSIVLHAYERHSYSTRTPYKNWMKCTASYKLADDCGRGIVSCEQFSTIASRGCYWGDFLSIVDTDTGSFERFCQSKGPVAFKPKGDFKLRFVSNGRKTAKGINCAVTCDEPLRPTPVDCVETDWNTWSICSKTCGGGSRSRQRSVEKEEADGGESCGDLSEDEPCNTQACADADIVCENGWTKFNGMCYLLTGNQRASDSARQGCWNEDAELTSILSAEENTFLKGLSSDFWLGADYDPSTKSFSWADGNEWGYTNWSTNQPTDGDDCVKYLSDGWVSVGCASGLLGDAICKKDPGADDGP